MKPTPRFPTSPEIENIPAFGLIAWLEQTRIVLPLKAVDVDFSIFGDLAEVRLDQIFHQTSRQALDVTYNFPLPAGVAVYRCELIVNDRVIRARVEEQGRAREIAREMKATGHRTSLVEMERGNLFTLSLGNVQPDDLVIIRFAWFQTLDHAQAMKSLLVPFTPGIRYIPGRPLLRGNRGHGTESDTDQVPDASRISPPRIDQLRPDAALLSLRGTMDTRFIEKDSVSSATHTLLLRDEPEQFLVLLPNDGQVPDRDFVLRWKEKMTPGLEFHSVSGADEIHTYAVVRLDAPENAPVTTQQNCDYYFLVDRSGSMQGRKWTCTAQALRAFVGELGETDRVWVTLFESGFQDYAEAPLPAGELRKDPAFAGLENLGTGGGTELLPALNHVLRQIENHSANRSPVIILLTDGQVGNEAQVLKTMAAHPAVPLHAFGVDTAVNEAFLKQLTARQRGACMLMTPNDDIQGAVSRLGYRLRRPVLTHLTASTGWELASASVSDLHAGEHLLVAVRGPKSRPELTLTGRLPDGVEVTYPFTLRAGGLAVPRLLWAREAIQRLLDSGKKSEAIRLAIEHNLICEGAAFIAYDEQEKVAVAQQEIYQPAMEVVSCLMMAGSCSPAPVARAAKVYTNSARVPAPGSRTSSFHVPDLLDLPSVPSLTKKVGEFFGKLKQPKSTGFEEIQHRYAIAPQITVIRSQILYAAWREQCRKNSLFSGPKGELIGEILGRWALEDAAPRFALLAEVSPISDAEELRDFIKRHVMNRQQLQDLLRLLDRAAV